MHRMVVHVFRSLILSTIAVFTTLSGIANGQTPLLEESADERFSSSETTEIPDFQRHVIPMLGRLGCNSAKCHGSFQGQGGFRLSLFGFDFESDHRQLVGEAFSVEGNRLNSIQPGESLIIQKPTELVDHDGGLRFEEGSWEHHLLLRWIESGAAGASSTKEIKRLEVEPSEIVFKESSDLQQLRVIAVWLDGTKEDVTCLCRFRTNDDAIVKVDENGLAKSTGMGDTHIVAFYDNGVAAVPVMLPYSVDVAVELPSYSNPIDQLVADKLRKLGIAPSDICTDTEFLRRVSIDMTGSLPTPQEVLDFLSDTSEDKRARKIDELLDRQTYSAWWANKLCDFTGCNPTAQAQVTEVGQALSSQWYDWIQRRVEDNMPYDDLVSRIVLSQSRREGQSIQEYAEEMSSYVRRENPGDFSERETMPHYWTRRSLNEPKDTAMSVAHSFLGIQLQCAECHKHPFDRWTQSDFNDFASFFEPLRVRGPTVGFPQFSAAQSGGVVGWRELRVELGEARELSLLRSGMVTLEATDDPRVPIMEWMRRTDNPMFARAFVNRVWASYFHVGIVDPPDQFTPANPPSNPALLEWLTNEFIEHDYDMRWLHRQIATSDTYQRSWKPNETNREDRRNFSRAIPRRIPAEVVYDALKQATAASPQLEEVRNNLKRRASGHLSMRMAGTYAMKVFGKPERALNCDCERVNQPTLLQTVFLHNDPLVRMRIADSGWIADLRDASANKEEVDLSNVIQQLWLRTVNRLPTTAEEARARSHIDEVESLDEGVSDLMWALINTKEFILNK